jgi:predicted ATP-grasp superfamily ATP-dependent carboligase
LSDNRDELKKYYEYVYPKKSTVNLLLDKAGFHQWATDQGFPVPESYIASSQKELDAILRDSRFPVVLKPLIRTDEWLKRAQYDKVFKLNNRREVENIGFDLFSAAPKFIVQRWISGGDSNVHFCLTYFDRHGRELGYYTGRKLLQYPLLTGNTAIGVGTFNEEIHNLAKEVLHMAKLRGLGSLEAKKSDEDGKYYITEPTVGRNNYQSYMAVAGGMNLTEIALHDAINEQNKLIVRKRRKVTWIDEDFTPKAIECSVRQRSFSYKVILKGLNARISLSIFNFSDPMPFMIFLKKLFRKLLIDFKRFIKLLLIERLEYHK